MNQQLSMSAPSIDRVIAVLEERIRRNDELSGQIANFKNNVAPPKRRSVQATFELDPAWLRNTHTRQREQFVDENLKSLRVKKFEWDEDEVEKLKALVAQSSGSSHVRIDESVDWSDIGGQLKRSPADCRIKYMHFVSPESNCGAWSKEEDLLLVSLVNKYNGLAWQDVARDLSSGRTAAACFQRYQRTLNPTLGGEFTVQEDARLVGYMQTHTSSSWSQITADLGFARTPDQVSRRWKILTRSSGSGGESKWTEEAEKKLVQLAEIYGERNWVAIAEHFEDKDEIRCRERYQDVLKSGGKANAPWAGEEDEKLLIGVIVHGAGNWARIAKDIPERTDRGCLQRWRILDPEAADKYLEKARIARKLAIGSSCGRDLEKSELTPADLFKILVPSSGSVTPSDPSDQPVLLYEGPIVEETD